LKHLKVQRFKPKFDDEENKQLDLKIDILVTDLTIVTSFLLILDRWYETPSKIWGRWCKRSKRM